MDRFHNKEENWLKIRMKIQVKQTTDIGHPSSDF